MEEIEENVLFRRTMFIKEILQHFRCFNECEIKFFSKKFRDMILKYKLDDKTTLEYTIPNEWFEKHCINESEFYCEGLEWIPPVYKGVPSAIKEIVFLTGQDICWVEEDANIQYGD